MNKASSQTPEPGNPLSPGSIDQQLIDDFDKPVSTSRRTIPTVIREYFSSYIWKVDANILPLFIVLYIFSVMDRNNIGNAKVAGLDKDLGLHGEQFNWVVSSMFFTYIFCEIPANIMLKKVHPRVWFPIIIIAWGGVCMCLAAGKSYASLIILRLILGAFEAGFVPGFIYYISFWYTKRQQGPRLSLFFSAGTFAGIFAGPLAAALTNINGKLKEYQYIFLVEGGVTVFLGIVSIFLLSNYPESARFLTKEEKETAVKLLKREQALSGGRHVILSQVPKFLLDWKLWAYGIIFWISSTAGITQAIFGPTLIASMGYTSTKAQIMSSLPSTCGFVSQLLSMFIPRIFPRLSVLIMIQALFTCACYIVLATTTGNKLRMAFLCLANFGTSPIMPYVSLWMLNNTVGVTQRAVGSGLTIMLGGIGGLIGSHLYREMDKPYYRHGHRIIAVLFGISFLLTLSLAAFFFFENRRRDKLEFGRNHNSDGGQTPGGDVDLDDGDTEVELMGDKLQSHRYTF